MSNHIKSEKEAIKVVNEANHGVSISTQFWYDSLRDSVDVNSQHDESVVELGTKSKNSTLKIKIVDE